MTLKDFLSKKGLSAVTFAGMVDYSEPAVSNWLSGKRFPEPAAIAAIEAETKGWVKAADWYRQRVQATEG